MPVTLEQARLNIQDHIVAGVIDEFRKESYLMDALTFDDAVSPTGGGGTLVYGYTRLKTESGADFREINTEYVPSEAEKERFNVELKPFGGSYQIDRIIAEDIGGFISEIVLQSSQKVKSTTAKFCNEVINGDVAQDSRGFDGLEVALTGSSTEYILGSALDLSTQAAMEANGKLLMDEIDNFLSLLYQKPTALLANSKLINKIKSVARRVGYFSRTEDAFGRKIDTYDGIPLVNVGDKPASSSPIIPVNAANGETPLYAVCLGLDGLHGVSLAGRPPIRTWLPDYTTAGAVKTGEVEMIAAIALKRTKAAGVMRKIKVI